MFSSSVIEQTEKLLEEVLESIRQEHERPDSVLSETDRREFIREQASLSKLLKEASSGSQSSVWGLLKLASPQARKCLEDAKALRQCVKEEIEEKVRRRVSRESRPSSNRESGSAVNFTNPWGTEADIRPPSAEGNNISTEITSPANPRHELPELSELNISPTTDQEASSHRPGLPEAIDARLSGNRSSDSSNGRRRRPPPPPPLPRRMAQSDDSESDDSSSEHRRRSPPRVDMPHRVNAHLRRGWGGDEGCFKIIDSNVQGMTVNRDSMHCSGAVIHTVMVPSRSSRPASQV